MYGTFLPFHKRLVLVCTAVSTLIAEPLLMGETFKNVAITAYDNCKVCCGENYSAKYPRTASGTTPKIQKTVACNWLPFGTIVEINGQRYTVEDRMAKRYSDRIDIFVSSHALAKEFGIRRYTVKVISKPKKK